MSTLSDVQFRLEYNATLNALSSWISDNTLINSWASIVISFHATQDTLMTLSFSNDGVNFDINITKNFTANISDYYPSVVFGKWCRIRLDNLAAAQSVTRMFTYCNVQNTSLSATISKVGRITPEVNIGNLPRDAFGTPISVQLTPWSNLQFDFSRLYPTGAPLNAAHANLSRSPYYEVTNIKSNNTATSTISYENQLLSICGATSANDWCCVSSHGSFPYRAGQGQIVRFTSSCALYTNEFTAYHGIGLKADLSLVTLTSGAFLKYSSSSGFQVCYIGASGEVAVGQSSFNGDKLDGTGVSGFTLDESKVNVFEIGIGYLGSAGIQFRIKIPGDPNGFLTFHTFNTENDLDLPHLYSPSGQMIMQTEKTSVTSRFASYDYRVSCGSFACFISDTIEHSQHFSTSRSISTTLTTETMILNTRNNRTFNNRVACIPIRFTKGYISAIQTGGGGGASISIITLRVYRFPTYTGAGAWSDVKQYGSVMQTNTTSTFSSFGTLLYTCLLQEGQTVPLELNQEALIQNPDTSGDFVFTVQSSAAVNIDHKLAVVWDEY